MQIESYLQNIETKKYGNIIAYGLPAEKIVDECDRLYNEHGLRLKTITAKDERKENGSFRIMYIFGMPGENVFLMPFISVKGDEFPSIVNVVHESSWYERKIKTFFGLHPKGHPNPRQILLQENWPDNIFPLRKDFDGKTRPGQANTPYQFHKVEGEGIYEIPVGPVHAGIIEPGHFRFSVAGEEILLLEPRLGFTHKGSEKLFETLPLPDKLKLSERISGDSSFNHSLAFCQAAESLAGIEAPERAKYLRVIFAEMERIANHFGDIGAIMLDTGFSFGGANGGRLREMVIQWNEKLTGSRFLRGVNAIGGVTKDISEESRNQLSKDLDSIFKDFKEVIDIAENSNSLYNRLKDSGTLDKQIARDHGVIGVAGRAAGLSADARIDYPYAAYDKFNFEIAVENGGDVNARYLVRIKEVSTSMRILQEALEKMPSGPIASGQQIAFKSDFYALGIAEGWRGDIVYMIATDESGNISRVEVRDPSFLNWAAVGHAGKGNVVPDFPLINKSFNLSYSGNDL